MQVVTAKYGDVVCWYLWGVMNAAGTGSRKESGVRQFPTLRHYYPGLSRITGMRLDGSWTRSRHSLVLVNEP